MRQCLMLNGYKKVLKSVLKVRRSNNVEILTLIPFAKQNSKVILIHDTDSWENKR